MPSQPTPFNYRPALAASCGICPQTLAIPLPAPYDLSRKAARFTQPRVSPWGTHGAAHRLSTCLGIGRPNGPIVHRDRRPCDAANGWPVRPMMDAAGRAGIRAGWEFTGRPAPQGDALGWVSAAPLGRRAERLDGKDGPNS